MTKWDKLILRIRNLSKDLRFAELRKVLEAMDMRCMRLGVEAAIIHLENKAAGRLRYRNMNPSRKRM